VLFRSGCYDARATPDKRTLFVVQGINRGDAGYRVYRVDGQSGRAEFVTMGEPGLMVSPDGRYVCYNWLKREELARRSREPGKYGYLPMVRIFDVDKREVAKDIDFAAHYPSSSLYIGSGVDRFDADRNAFMVNLRMDSLLVARFAIAVPSWEVARLE
jgi:hypothetical protein